MFARAMRFRLGLAGICLLAAGSFVTPSVAHYGGHTVLGIYPLKTSGPWNSITIYVNGPNRSGKVVATRGTAVTLMTLDCVVEEFYPGSAGHITYARGRTNAGALWYFSVQDAQLTGRDTIQITDVPSGLPCGYSSISSPNRGILEGVAVTIGRPRLG